MNSDICDSVQQWFHKIWDHVHNQPITSDSRVLFVLKLREDYNQETLLNFDKQQVATGMYNSATFVSNMLKSNGIASNVVVVVDNNCIDREVTLFKPTHVFIEGYWVVPDKFDQLKPLHPNVDWIVRCHSEIPFLSQEGIAINWTYEYLKRGVKVAGNSPRIASDIKVIARQIECDCDASIIDAMCPYLPNYYPTENFEPYVRKYNTDTLNIGCFGAIRPLKNHLIQAIAAIRYADACGKKLRFHINQGRIEMNGNNTIKNLKALFADSYKHELVEHPWTGHAEFLSIIRQMDICMQVSFTETFNIVTADAVAVGTPVTTSDEIWWAHPPFTSPNNSEDIAQHLYHTNKFAHHNVVSNQHALRKYSRKASQVWLNYLST